MNVQFAVLYQDGAGWDEIIIDVPDICSCMSYAEIDEKARMYFFSAPELDEYDNCFGGYVTNEGYQMEYSCSKCQKRSKDSRIWDILAMVNEHFREEMSDLLDEDFDKLLQELAE